MHGHAPRPQPRQRHDVQRRFWICYTLPPRRGIQQVHVVVAAAFVVPLAEEITTRSIPAIPP